MLQTLERTGRDSYGTNATPAPLKAKSPPGITLPEHDDAPAAMVAQPKPDDSLAAAALTRAEAHVEMDDGLLADAGPIMMAAYGLVLAIAVLTFRGSGEALLAVGVSIAFGFAFFGVPLVMTRTRARHDARWQKGSMKGMGARSDTVETYTGRVDRAEAVVHMVIVPVVVSVAFTCFAVIWALSRP